MCFMRFIYLLPWLLHITVREVQMGVFCEIYLFTTLVTTYHSERGTDGCVL